MKSDIHPKYELIRVTCACGNTFETKSTLGRDLNLEVCANCHPFYTGKQKIVDTAGRVDRFMQRYAKAKEATPPPVATAADTSKGKGGKSTAKAKTAAAKSTKAKTEKTEKKPASEE